MMHGYVFKCVHRTFSDIMKNENPIGGKIAVLGGDFRQVLPVIRHGSQADFNIHFYGAICVKYI